MTAAQQAELDVLKTNLELATCVGKPACQEQQQARRERIAEIEAA